MRRSAELPPRPDPETGRPIPPHAPAYSGPETSADDPMRERRLSRRPQPPPDMGPTLAWHRRSWRSKLSEYVLDFVLTTALIAIISLLNEGSLVLLGVWQFWLFPPVTAYLIAKPLVDIFVAAGADWAAKGHKRWWTLRAKHRWVKLYELTRIEGDSMITGKYLRLADGQRGMGFALRDVQVDRRIWDLIYNGILHSVAAGAEIDAAAIHILQLDGHPALEAGRRAQLTLKSKLIVAGPDKLTDAEIRRIKLTPLGEKLMNRNGVPFDVSPAIFREVVKQELSANPQLFTEPDSTGRHAEREPAPYESLLRLAGTPPKLDRLTDDDIRWFLTTTDGRALRDASGLPDGASPDEFRSFVKKELGGLS